MSWFTREPKADPVGDICRLLAVAALERGRGS